MLTKIYAGIKNETVVPERVSLASVNAERLLETVSSRQIYCSIKRAMDIVFVLLAGPAVLLVVGLAAIAILYSMGGPAFYVQDRVGYRGRIFRIWKLRTMLPAPEKTGTATEVNDRRITPLGRFLRSTHIDELPQFWNILRGDMTLIGPRPEQVPLVEAYRESLPAYDLRHLVRPGLSGWSQVRYGYAETVHDTRNKLEYDLFYLSNLSPALDLKILVLTIAILRDPNMVR